jgi:hypothetical protein
MILSANWLNLPLSRFWSFELPNATDGKLAQISSNVRILICLFMIGSIPNCLAREWRGSVSTEVDVPSYVSIDQAELIGLRRLKELASLKAGEYVRVSETLLGEQYQRQIQSINASYVSITNVDKSIAVRDGDVKLTLKADATVDISLIDERIANDQSKTPRLDVGPKGKVDISIPLNHAKFELNTKEGVLSSNEVGLLSRFTRHSESLGIKQAMDVLNHLMYDARITSEVVSADISSDEFSALVNISYDYDVDKLVSFFPVSIRFQYRNQREHPVLVIFRPSQVDKEAVAFYKFLSAHLLGLDLTSGSFTATIPVLYHGNDHFSGCRVGSVDVGDSDVLCIQKISNSDGALNTRFLKNTIAISQARQGPVITSDAFNVKAQVSMVAR